MSEKRPQPEVHIVLRLEEPPRVRICCDSAEDEARVRFWVTTNRDLYVLVEQALELAERRAA